ncbi:MAG: cyclic dehypoxanthinyl futalosine synthase [Candidatus Ancaeobacter aquaticus]|nr:cyclic dehypoxanthinyl futalosine synthase [Candidatus Ancaeobacter aquaticus]
MNLDSILTKAREGKRLSIDEGTLLFNADLVTLGAIAESRKAVHHKEPIVTFVIDRNITFTNVCVCQCDFCAFYVSPQSRKAFLLNEDEILKSVKELVDMGGTQVMLQGGLNPEVDLEYYLSILKKIKESFPVHIHSFSVAEIVYLSKKEGISAEEVLKKMQEAGLDSLPGAAEILVDRVRKKVSPNKTSTSEWIEVMKSAHALNMHTTATMTFGMVETTRERMQHLECIRNLQDETGGFKAFIPWTFSPRNTKLSSLKAAGGVDYLMMLAISRIYLDNFPHIHTGWVTEGEKLAQIGLMFGANDMGGILMDEVVVKATGINNSMTVDKIVHLIQSAGMIPAQRNSKYEIIRYF